MYEYLLSTPHFDIGDSQDNDNRCPSHHLSPSWSSLTPSISYQFISYSTCTSIKLDEFHILYRYIGPCHCSIDFRLIFGHERASDESFQRCLFKGATAATMISGDEDTDICQTMWRLHSVYSTRYLHTYTVHDSAARGRGLPDCPKREDATSTRCLFRGLLVAGTR